MNMKKYGLYTALVASMAFTSQAQATFVIDDFSAPASISLPLDPTDTTDGVAFDAVVDGVGNGDTFMDASILGGERDIYVELLTQGSSAFDGVLMGVDSGSLSYATGDGDVATASLQYDGKDGDATTVDTAGLGSEDFLSYGNAFIIDVLSSDIGFSFAINVWSNMGSGFSTLSGIGTGTMTPMSRSFAFSDFVGDADFTQVSALEFVINTEGQGGTPSIDFSIDALKVPEPATMALFGMGLMGLGYTRRRKAKAELIKA